MVSLQFGDLAKWYLGQRQTHEIKANLDRLSNELSSGVKQDLPAHLGHDRIRVAEMDELLGRISVYDKSNSNVSGLLSAQQLGLSSIEGSRAYIARASLGVEQATYKMLTADAHSRFSGMVSSLNSQFAGQSVFAGNKTDTAPVAASDDIISNLGSTINFSQPAGDIVYDIISYFTDAGGAYLSSHYQGGDSSGLDRQISESDTVSIATTAKDSRIARTLALTAAIAVADSAANAEEATAIVKIAAEQLQGERGVIDLQAELGLEQAKAASAKAKNSASKTSLQIERNERVSADPYSTAVELKKVETQIQTHFALLSRLSKLTLANYIR